MADFEDEEPFDEEDIIRYYFFRGFSYEEMRMFLEINNGIEMSIRTLKS